LIDGTEKAARRVVLRRAELARAAIDRPQRRDRSRDRGGGEAVSGELVHVALQTWQVDLAQPLMPERGQHALTQVLLVAPNRRRLIGLARAVAHDPGARRCEPIVSGLLERRAAIRA
jgi:hypothetical protein